MNIFEQLFQWGGHANYDTSTAKEWLAGLVLIVLAGMLWAQVVMKVID